MSIWPSIERSRGRLREEHGTIRKVGAAPVSVALAFPNVYKVGMAGLGFQIIYRLLNSREDTLCERVFYPDGEDLPLFASSGRLFTMESERPVANFTVLAFSLSFEMDIPRLLRMLTMSGLPLRASDRGPEHPLVMVGGPVVTFNPEPLAEFMDFCLVGEAEEALPEIMDIISDGFSSDLLCREDLFYRLAGVGGIYVPSLYEVGYDDVGRVTDVVASGGAPQRVRRRWTANLDAYSGSSTVISPDMEFSNTWLIEISRGCGRRCRFCMAGHCYLPPRRRSKETILAAARQGLQLTDRIGLVGAAISDYPGIDDLSWELTSMGAKLSVASLRVDTLGPGLLRSLAAGRSRTLTVAPEAGSERLRRIINKRITEEHIINGVRMAAEAGFRNLKFYFIIGLPGEREEDIRAIVDLVLSARDAAPGLRFELSVASFVPKPFTPFQWSAMVKIAKLEKHVNLLRTLLRKYGSMDISVESSRWSAIQGIMARGDRRLAPVLASVAAEGDSISVWRRSMKQAGLNYDFYLYRIREEEEVFPWDHLDIGLEKAHLRQSYNESLSEY
jgi:radical SAM superfamily enzyme YgiQ (UPF0313 family)